MTTTTVAHPALRGRVRVPHQARRRRRLIVPGEATSAFWVLAAVVTVLNMFGLVMVMSASSVVSVREGGGAWSYFEKQAMWTILGIPALFACLLVSLDFWRKFVRVGLLASIGMLVAVLLPGIGRSANGATRWISVGPIQLQPSEFAKFGLMMFVADLLDRRAPDIDDWRQVLRPVVIVLAVVAGLVMLQPNLGTTIIIAAMVLAMLWAAGTPIAPLGLVTLAGALAAIGSVASTPFRRTRFLRFLNPWGDPSNTGLQNIQSMVGLANGGVLGRGLGRSTAKWGFLPYAHTDFIFAIIGEEFGLVGALTVVLLFGGLGVLGAWIALRARDRFSMLVAVGITTWFTVQAIMNIGAVIGIMPITGVPLPFVSFGGSSLLTTLAATGILLNIALHPAQPGRLARP
ncbi:MAG: FtsW [Acidimicrobiales bacterium]|nr:FtsW [Acidimicrobiales bacterium]